MRIETPCVFIGWLTRSPSHVVPVIKPVSRSSFVLMDEKRNLRGSVSRVSSACESSRSMSGEASLTGPTGSGGW